MEDSFFVYLQRLEGMLFFSGYPMVYAILLFVAGLGDQGPVRKKKVLFLLPYAYALAGTLYLGLQLKNAYPDYSLTHILLVWPRPWLALWGLLSLLLWVPALPGKPAASLLHSLVYFFFVIRDTLVQVTGSGADQNLIGNDMRVYTYSLFLHVACFTGVALPAYLIVRLKQRKSV